MGRSWPVVVVVLAGIVVSAAARAEDQAARRDAVDGIVGPIGRADEPVHNEGHSDCCDLEDGITRGRVALALRARAGRSHQVVVVRLKGRAPYLAVQGEALVALRPEATAEIVSSRNELRILSEHKSARLAVLGRPGAAPEALVAALVNDPAVAHVTPNWIAAALLTPNDPLFHTQKGARSMDLEAAWDLARGAGVTVAVLDTGIDPSHPDLQGALAPNGWIDLVNQSASPQDDNGHGTAMAGVIAARFQDGFGMAGVAPEASLLVIKVADREGHASFADLIAGIDAAIARGAPIIAISLGAYIDDPLLEQAVQRARAAGSLVIAAAGNENLGAPLWPAAYDDAIAVGGAGPGPTVAFNTVIAPSVDLLAPAEEIAAPLPGGVVTSIGGTSAACAHAAGVAALALSRTTTLSRDGLAQVLRSGVEPIGVLRGLPEAFPFGGLNARRAVERAEVGFVDVGVLGHRVQPEVVVSGRPAIVHALVRNAGDVATPSVIATARYKQQGLSIEIQPLAVPPLAPGETRPLVFTWTQPPAPGLYEVEVRITPPAGDREASNDLSRSMIRIDNAAPRGLAILRMDVKPAPRFGRVEVEAIVRNLSAQDEPTVQVQLTADGRPFAVRTVVIPERRDATIQATWTVPPGGAERVRFGVKVAGLPGEQDLVNNLAIMDARVGVASARPINVFYQQSNGVDLIADAPYRVGPQRTYVPIQVFCPSKADSDTGTYLTFAEVRVRVQDDPLPGSPATTLYQDATGSPPTTTVPGLDILDELGQPLGSAEIFSDDRLHQNGRYNVLRIPKAACGVAMVPAQPIAKYFDVVTNWRFHRPILFFTATRTGSHRKMLRVTFGAEDLPRLPGEGHYYDAHNHTIAEWYFDSWLAVFAPRKAYGGPLGMLNEVAAAVGLIDDPTNVKDLVAITDHSSFYNTTVGDPNDPTRRPPFGPSSPAASLGANGAVLPEGERYREIYGLAAGEEVAVHEVQGFSINGQVIGLPMGSHMLVYQGPHVEGPWHGGGFIPDPSSPNIDVDLDATLRTFATTSVPQGPQAFAFAAHPQSGGLGWHDTQLDLVLGLDPARRTLDHVHAQPPNFAYKGLQVWNGRSERHLPSSAIDFNDLNPFVHAAWQAARAWDTDLVEGLARWHDAVSEDLLYAFASEPDVVFCRKVLIAAGTDAHGDFNYEVSRLATPITFDSTFSVGSTSFGAVRTYVMTNGIQAPTAGERFMRALSGGRSVLTDGPLIGLTMDAEGRFDGTRLVWHDQQSVAEDDDGLIGGHGALDGGGTLLLVSGSEHVWYRYRYDNIGEYGSGGGAITALKLYKDEYQNPNPTIVRRGVPEPVSVGSLALGGAGLELSERIDPLEEGTITVPTAMQASANTGGDPDIAVLDGDEHRAYTNAIFALPIDVSVSAPQTRAASIPAGGLVIAIDFPITMQARDYSAEVRALDSNGDSSTDPQARLDTLAATWTSPNGVRSSRLTLTNTVPIPATGDEYPVGRKSFVVYTREAPRDHYGNELNHIAFSFAVPWGGPQQTGSVTSPSTGSGARGSSGGPLGGLGCQVGLGDPGGAAPLGAALLALLWARVRRRRGRSSCDVPARCAP